jgi:hypothetical protein
MMFGFSPESGGGGSPETKPEMFHLLRTFLDHKFQVLVAGGIQELEEILEEFPQRDEYGNLMYLLTSGLAIGLLTGFTREHHDIDLVIMDPNNLSWEIMGTDNITPETYWADMSFSAKNLEETSVKVVTRAGGVEVELVHPAIMLVQKASEAFRRTPRKKDYLDVEALIEYYKENREKCDDWIDVIESSVRALPRLKQKRTVERLSQLWEVVGEDRKEKVFELSVE